MKDPTVYDDPTQEELNEARRINDLSVKAILNMGQMELSLIGRQIAKAILEDHGKEFHRLYDRPISDIFCEHGIDQEKYDAVIEWRPNEHSTIDRLNELGPEHLTLFHAIHDVENRMFRYFAHISEQKNT